jgi:hypothetical protein
MRTGFQADFTADRPRETGNTSEAMLAADIAMKLVNAAKENAASRKAASINKGSNFMEHILVCLYVYRHYRAAREVLITLEIA